MGKVNLAGFWILILALTQAASVGRTAVESEARLELTTVVALSHEVFRVELHLVKTTDEPIVGTENIISFSPALSVVDVIPGKATEEIGAKLSLDKRSDQEREIIILRINAPQGESLPGGTIALLNFKIVEPELIEESQQFTLENEAYALYQDGRRLKAEAKNGYLLAMTEVPIPLGHSF